MVRWWSVLGLGGPERGVLPVELTAREYELFLLFIRHPRQVLTRDQILERVWGYDSEADTHVLDVHIGHLRQKLEADGAPRRIQTIRGSGYPLRD